MTEQKNQAPAAKTEIPAEQWKKIDAIIEKYKYKEGTDSFESMRFQTKLIHYLLDLNLCILITIILKRTRIVVHFQLWYWEEFSSCLIGEKLSIPGF